MMIEWIQKWYGSHCDSKWEHSYGIKIETLDNPGWCVEIDIAETDIKDKTFEEIDKDVSDTDWITCRVQNGKFEGFGDVFKLSEILLIFKNWAQS